MNAAAAAWCREVVDTVLELLRPHTLWYAAVHRISPWALIAAAILAVVSVPLASIWGFPQWSVFAVPLYLVVAVRQVYAQGVCAADLEGVSGLFHQARHLRRRGRERHCARLDAPLVEQVDEAAHVAGRR